MIYILSIQINGMVRKGISKNLVVGITIVVVLAVALNVILIVNMNLAGFSHTSENIIATTVTLINEDTGELSSGESASGDISSGTDEPNTVIEITYADSIADIGGTTYYIDEVTGIVAIDPSSGGETVTSEHTISIGDTGFEYDDYDSFVLVPDDDVPSMVLIFDEGSIKSTLYLDNDAIKLLEDPNSSIEIGGTLSMTVDKSDIKKVTTLGLYVVEIKSIDGRTNLETGLERELMSGSMVIYPLISTGESEIMGSRVIIDEYTDLRFFEIRSISDLFLWLNLKFNMDLNNNEKQIMQKGILDSLDEMVEANK